MITLKFLYPEPYWDQTMLKDILSTDLFTEQDLEKAIVVLPGANHVAQVKEINKTLSQYKHVVLLITSDEESLFPVEQIKHPSIRIYLQYPKQGRHDNYGKLPIGYTPHTRPNLSLKTKKYDWFFAGQVTHERREQCFKALQGMENGDIHKSEGFAQGLEPKEYIEKMSRARVVPAPSGPICADSFRLYEALETGAIPIGDNISPAGDKDYWYYLLGHVPFPTIDDYNDLPGYINDLQEDFTTKANRIQAWYLQLKRTLRQQFILDLDSLAGKQDGEAMTVVIPVSPIKSHPSTHILEETVKSIRAHLDCEILITFDGVRPQQEKMRKDYEEFIRRAIHLCNTEWKATPYIFDNHEHQTGMMRSILNAITSPMILYVEQDTPLTPDLEIDWQRCAETIYTGEANLIRFHFEAVIPEAHKHMMLGETEHFIKTAQWSQRPHLASTAYYRRIMKDYFTPNAKSFIEDNMHGILHEAFVLDGMQGWLQHRVVIYKPADHLKRSYHTDGREGAPKYDDSQIF